MGQGFLIVIAFTILVVAIVATACMPPAGKEGFTAEEAARVKVVPPPTRLTSTKEPKGITAVTDLPSAPIAALAETNSFPYQDPALAKASTAMIRQLVKDMEGFEAFELQGLKGKSDPAVQLPLTRFAGDLQTLKDELSTLDRNPGLQSQLTVLDVNDAAANLRFLQRTYRVYADNQIVPDPRNPVTQVGMVKDSEVEGFTNSTDENPITSDQLDTLATKLAVEITRLQASGSTDPVLQARVNVFTKIRQQVTGIQTQLRNGTLRATDIPIKVRDYNRFLPALGNSSSGIGGLISRSGNSTLSSLFDSYEQGDISGSELAGVLFEKYAKDILSGLSYNVTVNYTSPNEVALESAKATRAVSEQKMGMGGVEGVQQGGRLGGHPGTVDGSRGEFERLTRQMDLERFDNPTNESEAALGPRPPTVVPTPVGKFDWEARATTVCENIKRFGLNPADFGCLPAGARVSSDYSWRGHTKMICSRLETHKDPGVPEQMGCPPVSWTGWRL
jgi:hypothetical protein